jgi:hypothetical protein
MDDPSVAIESVNRSGLVPLLMFVQHDDKGRCNPTFGRSSTSVS